MSIDQQACWKQAAGMNARLTFQLRNEPNAALLE
jgi:hypothetical protein